MTLALLIVIAMPLVMPLVIERANFERGVAIAAIVTWALVVLALSALVVIDHRGWP